MTQLRNTLSTCAPQWKMWLFKVFGVLYIAAVCASQDFDASTYSYVRSTQPTTTLYVPPQPNLQLTSAQVDFFPSEKVELRCSVTNSLELTFTWKKDGNPLVSDPNLSWSPDKSVLTITASSQQDSGRYSCAVKGTTKPSQTTESNVVRVTVHESKPKPTLTRDSNLGEMFPGESIIFTCRVSVSSGWEYLWYRGDQEIKTPNTDTYNITSIRLEDKGQYHCKARRGQLITDASDSTTLEVSQPPTPVLTLQTGWTDVFENEAVEFRCEVVSHSPDWTFTWFRDKQQLQSDTVQTINGDGSSFKITSVSQTHKGSYTCQAHLPSRRVSSGVSNESKVEVNEIPVPAITERPRWRQVFPTESVSFSCGMERDSSNWIYTWYKDGKQVQADGSVSFDANEAKLSISSASANHEGRYKCSGQLKNRAVKSQSSSELSLMVHGEKPTLTLTKDPDYQMMFPGESVTFSCAINVSSDWQYMWYKDGIERPESSDKYLVKISATADGESYTCKARRGPNPSFTTDSSQAIQLQVKKNKPKPLITRRPDAKKLYMREPVSFECKVEISSGWSYEWYKNGTLILNNQNLNMNDLSWLNSGTYKCIAKRKKTNFTTEFSEERTLPLSEIPVPTLKPVTKWMDVFPTENATMSCGMEQDSTEWTYAWYRDGNKVQDYYSKNDQNFSITSASASDRGRYSCSGKLKSRNVYSKKSAELVLVVYDEKPEVTLVQNPKHDLMHSGDSVSFNCHVNVSTGWEYLWYKDGRQLGSSGSDRNISSVVTTDSGSYTCKVKRGRRMVFYSDRSNNVKLKVVERPKASIVLLTGWSKVFSTDSLVLKCEVMESTDMWNYTWFKEEEKIESAYSEIHVVTPQDDPDQSMYTCHGIRNERPLYSKTSDSFKTKNLLLKRRVLLSISGCIFFGIIAVFIGCVALRIFRRPAADDDRAEEVNLFPTMAQLKITDAPCPLVDYITDASLNAPVKEEEENGTVCNETTPLPITKQEDQAATNDSQETTETNGGLLSFQI